MSGLTRLGTVALADLARSTDRWPVFIDLCLRLNQSGVQEHRDLAQALAEGRFKLDPAALEWDCPGLHGRVKQLAALVRARAGSGHLPPPADLEHRLLWEAIVEGQEPGLLGGGRARVPVLLVLRRSGLPGDFAVADLYVWHVPVDGPSPEHLFVPAPASWLYEIDERDRETPYAASFRQSTQRAGQAIARRLSPAARPFALAWDLRPRASGVTRQALYKLLGDSAGAAFAIAGLLALLRDQVRAPQRRHLQLISGPQVGVSAALAPEKPDAPYRADVSDRLLPVGGIAAKLGILKAQEAGYIEVTKVFVATGQEGTSEALIDQPEACAHLDALIAKLASHIGGDLSAEQIELHGLLLQLPQDGGNDDDMSPAEAAIDQDLLNKVATQPPRSLRGYLLQRYAFWAHERRDKLHLNFVNLHLRGNRVRRPDEGEDPAGADRRPPYKSLQEVLADSGGADALLLMGDPGCGKTTLLRRFEMTQARQDLHKLAAGSPPGPICVWVALSGYPSDLVPPEPREAAIRAARSAEDRQHALALQTPMDELERCWKRDFGLMPDDLHTLANRYGVQFLFDGLNEIKPPAEVRNDPDLRAAALAGIRKTLVQGLRHARLQGAAPIFSVRVLERGAGLGQLGGAGGFTVLEVDVGDWDDEQMQRYLSRRLGAQKGRGV